MPLHPDKVKWLEEFGFGVLTWTPERTTFHVFTRDSFYTRPMDTAEAEAWLQGFEKGINFKGNRHAKKD